MIFAQDAMMGVDFTVISLRVDHAALAGSSIGAGGLRSAPTMSFLKWAADAFAARVSAF